MDSSPSALIKFLLPKTPFLLKTALWHSISMSPTSSKWDLRTEITVNMLRDMMGPNSTPTPISKLQHLTCKDPGVKGKVWVSKLKLDVPGEDDVRQILFKAIDDMGMGDETWTKPDQRPLEAEWNGYRADAKDDEAEPSSMSEAEKYENLVKETTSKVTLLYFHGGAMYLLDPATSRSLTGRLAKETGGRVFSVRYRLSPQGPFPSALLDCFAAYLSLLSPPPGSTHAPIPASEIVFGGDSAGGTCCTALLQLLLQIHRSSPAGQTPTVRFHGKDVEIPLPAGVALSSPQTDKREFPKDEGVWPSSPPRADLYCEGSALMHPLVSPLAAKDWSQSPPLFFSVGEEMLRDEGAVVAQRCVAQGVTVVWRDFEAMPHCFAMLVESNPASKVHFEEYGGFCRDVVDGKKVESNGVFIKAKTCERSDMDVKNGLTKITDEEVEAYMLKGKERIETKFRRGQDPSSERPML
ncbi:hypothetical protein G6011_11656 [Alternaria panax]|uniref:Alpha/beta hydrolase fold-3 domain-containing protein n=1 Tax=Alternaria panax TaxID=48097 RepID=A0AAD4NS53_9PLEO|nr:hypothetical protein G6011_11656 [Alternaria panax]